jgi:lipoic acid synthetase
METVFRKYFTATLGKGELNVAKPKWLKVKLPIGQKYTELRGLVDKYNLNTICTSGSCPNMGEWGEGTATFMILGNVCTRSCGFCGVKPEDPKPLTGTNQKSGAFYQNYEH